MQKYEKPKRLKTIDVRKTLGKAFISHTTQRFLQQFHLYNFPKEHS